MQNPSKIKHPRLSSPLKNCNGKNRKDKGRTPYLRHRKKLSREMWR